MVVDLRRLVVDVDSFQTPLHYIGGTSHTEVDLLQGTYVGRIHVVSLDSETLTVYISRGLQFVTPPTVILAASIMCHTVEPLTNDHPHQRPSLSYDHISCDGQWFLFVY